MYLTLVNEGVLSLTFSSFTITVVFLKRRNPHSKYNIVPWDFMCMHRNYAIGIALVSGLPKGGGGEEILDLFFLPQVNSRANVNENLVTSSLIITDLTKEESNTNTYISFNIIIIRDQDIENFLKLRNTCGQMVPISEDRRRIG